MLAVACGVGGAEVGQPAADELTRVRTERPECQEVVDRMQLPADLWPKRRVVVAAEVSGVVDTLEFEAGARVAEDSVLATIDTRSQNQAVAEAEAVYRRAALELERAQHLFAKRSITKQQVLDATTERDVADARLASARLQLEKSDVRAPWSGTVAEKRVEVGDYVVPGQPLAILVDVGRLRVRAPIPAADAPHVAAGSAVSVLVEGLTEEPLAGRVVHLGAELDRETRTLDVEAEIANPRGRLRPGMLARMEVARRTLHRAILVPLSALVEFEDETVVYVVEQGRALRRPVRLGLTVGPRVVVTDGLGEEDRVIVEGQLRVADGQPVEEV